MFIVFTKFAPAPQKDPAPTFILFSKTAPPPRLFHPPRLLTYISIYFQTLLSKGNGTIPTSIKNAYHKTDLLCITE